MHSTIFPFFTLEVRGDSGGADAQIQNSNSATNMLNNLRHLTARARGKEYAQQSFDSVVRVLLATVTQESITISGHWIVSCEETNDLFFYSYLLKSVGIQGLTNSK